LAGKGAAFSLVKRVRFMHGSSNSPVFVVTGQSRSGALNPVMIITGLECNLHVLLAGLYSLWQVWQFQWVVI
jgi:hypothetical protein